MQHFSKLIFVTHFRWILTVQIEFGKQKGKTIWNPTYYFLECFQTFKSSSDTLDRLPGADRWGSTEAVLNSSFQKRRLQAKKVAAQIIASQNVQKSPLDHIWDDFYTIPT